MNAQARKTWSILIIAIALLWLRATDASTSPVPSTPATTVSFPDSLILFIDESEERNVTVANIIASRRVRDAIPSGASRYWDVDVDTSGADKRFAELLATGKEKSPCVVSAREKRASVHAMPMTIDAMMAIIDRWKG